MTHFTPCLYCLLHTPGAASPRPAFAHSRPGEDPATWEPLPEHLHRVGDLAARFADAFGSAEWGRVAGLWHDLGKYRPEFQRRICGERVQAPHASTGAALAAERRLTPVAFAIAGHHAGLANPTESGDGGPLPLRQVVDDGTEILTGLHDVVPRELTEQQAPPIPAHLRALPPRGGAVRLATELWTRFLFSALVDADRLATEAFYEPGKRDVLGAFEAVPALAARLDAHLATFRADTPVNAMRAQVLADCRAAAGAAPGFFSLTVPTGGGKTLSGMAFALTHAVRHERRRVIVVAPFTSIIEQNAEVYRRALGPHNVVEHHSAVERAGAGRAAESDVRRQLAAENWDAPVVVTTAVQFFESLLSNDPARCRKLHNVARSVVVIDEAQTIPTEFLACLLDVLRELVRGYGCSVVLSTATQPALRRRPALVYGLDDVREIVGDVDGLARALQRVTVEWPVAGADPTPYADIAARLSACSRVLAVVHLTRDARVLAEALPAEGRFHLSTRMCAAHRAKVLREIRSALAAGRTCRVVSTQLVEAGVDVDFPVVYRAMAGLDSVAQAAGRCNRNGLLTDADGAPALGRVVVFRAETEPPPGVLRKGLAAAEEMLAAGGGALDFTDAQVLDQYFRHLYSRVPHDPKGVMPQREALNFANVARLARLIDDGGQHALVVPWADAAARLRAFAARPGRETARALQRFVVQVRERDLRVLDRLGAVSAVEGFGYELAPPYAHLYHREFGLLVDEDASADPALLVT